MSDDEYYDDDEHECLYEHDELVANSGGKTLHDWVVDNEDILWSAWQAVQTLTGTMLESTSFTKFVLFAAQNTDEKVLYDVERMNKLLTKS